MPYCCIAKYFFIIRDGSEKILKLSTLCLWLSLMKKSLLAYAALGIDVAIGLVYQSIGFRIYGADAIGYLAIALVLIVYAQTLVEFGTNTVGAKDVVGVEDQSLLAKKIFEYSAFRACMAIISMLVFGVVGYFFFKDSISKNILFLLLLQLPLVGLTPVWLFIGKQWIWEYSKVQILAKAFSAIYALFVILADGGLAFYSGFYVVNSLFLCVFSWFVINKKVSGFSFKLGGWFFLVLKKNLSYFFSNLVFNLNRYFYIIVVSRFLPIGDVAIISAADKIVNAIGNFRFPINQLAFSEIIKSSSSKNNFFPVVYSWLVKVFFVSVSLAVILYFFRVSISKYLVGDVYFGRLENLLVGYCAVIVSLYFYSFSLNVVSPVLKDGNGQLLAQLASVFLFPFFVYLVFDGFGIFSIPLVLCGLDFIIGSWLIVVVARKVSNDL